MMAKINPFGAEFSVGTHGHTDGRTNMTKLIVAIRNFMKVPNEQVIFKFHIRDRVINFII
jgi:hypothetical protein